jgi:hypothetical protein
MQLYDDITILPANNNLFGVYLRAQQNRMLGCSTPHAKLHVAVIWFDAVFERKNPIICIMQYIQGPSLYEHLVLRVHIPTNIFQRREHVLFQEVKINFLIH